MTKKQKAEHRAQARRELRAWRGRWITVEIGFRDRQKNATLEMGLIGLAKQLGLKSTRTGTWLSSGIRELEFRRTFPAGTSYKELVMRETQLRENLANECQESGTECHFAVTVQA